MCYEALPKTSNGRRYNTPLPVFKISNIQTISGMISIDIWFSISYPLKLMLSQIADFEKILFKVHR